MNSPAQARRSRTIWLVTGVVLLGVAIGLFVLGVTPWGAPVATLLCLTLAIGQRTSWPFAFAAAVIVELAAMAVVIRLTPDWTISLVGGVGVVLALLGILGLVGFALIREPRLIGARELRVTLPLLAVPVVLVIAILVRSVPGADFEWAMRNDAVWNLVTTRMMIDDGGLDSISHPSASPLTPGLLAIVAAVGRAGVAPGALLAHDVQRFATFWLVGALVAAMLAALIGARSVHGGARWARVVAAGVTGLIPVSWFAFGFAAQFGFYNATVALVLLLATWLAWLETRVAPVIGVAVLSLATVALLATWAPLALIAFALAAVAVGARLSVLIRGRQGWRPYALLAIAVAPVPLYVLAVTLPDLARDGGALAVDGAIMPIAPVHVVIIAAMTIAIAVLNARQRHQAHQLIGVIAVCVSGALAGGYLVYQRVGSPNLWGYYPAKFAWLLVTLLLVILAAGIASEMATLRGQALAAAGVAVVAGAVPVTLMLLVPPSTPPATAVLAPVAIATNTGIASGDPAAEHLFELAEPGTPTLVLSYMNWEVDQFINSWLLQLESTTAADPIRLYSYILNPGDEPGACKAVRAWDREVRVVTSDPTLPARFERECDGAEFVVDVVDVPGSIYS